MARAVIALLFSAIAWGQQYQMILVPSEGKTGRLVFRELKANGTNEVRLKVPDAIAADVDFTLPAADGAANFSIATNGSGVLSFKEMVTAFDTGATTQTVLSAKFFGGGLKTVQWSVNNTISATPVLQAYVNGWGAGDVDFLNSSGNPSMSLHGEAVGAGGPALIEMFEPSTGVVTNAIQGGSGSAGGRLSLSSAAGEIGFFVSASAPVASATVYAPGAVPAIKLSGNGYAEFTQIATPGGPLTDRNRLYFKDTGELCSVDTTGAETCYGISTGSIPNPLEVGGAGCGEIKLKEDVGTGTRFFTFQVCEVSGDLTFKLLDSTGITRIKMVDASTTSIEAPVSFTTTGVEYARVWTALGNGKITLKNSSGVTGINLGNYPGGSQLNMVDTNGDGYLLLSTGNTDGAIGEFYAADTTRLGLVAAGGSFVTGGYLKTFDVSSVLVNTIDENGMNTSLLQTRTLQLNGALGGSLTFTVPAITSTYSLVWPNGTGTAGQCLSLATTSTLGWTTCSGGSFVDLTTNQNLAGNKFTTGAWRATELAVRPSSGASNVAQLGYLTNSGYLDIWTDATTQASSIRLEGIYGGTGGQAGISMFAPGGSETFVVKSGITGSTAPSITLRNTSNQVAMFVSGTGQGSFYSAGTEYIRLSPATQTISIFGDGLLTASGASACMAQTGDSLGDTTACLFNRTGINGIDITTTGVDLAEFRLVGSAGSKMTSRMEGRSGSQMCAFSSPELQMGFADPSGSVTDFGLVATRYGGCIPASKPLRFTGSTGGAVDFKAPASVSTYSLTWPAATGTAGQCLSLATTTTLGWATCSGGSFVDLSTNQSLSGNKYNSSAWRGSEFGARASSGGGNVWQSYIGGGGQGITEVWTSAAGAVSAQMTGNYSASGFAAITLNASGGGELIKIGGSSSNSITIAGASGTGTRVFMSGGSLGGQLSIYDSTSQELFRFSSGGVRVWNGFSLLTGYTGSLSTGSCTIDVFNGIITGHTGC